MRLLIQMLFQVVLGQVRAYLIIKQELGTALQGTTGLIGYVIVGGTQHRAVAHSSRIACSISVSGLFGALNNPIGLGSIMI